MRKLDLIVRFFENKPFFYVENEQDDAEYQKYLNSQQCVIKPLPCDKSILSNAVCKGIALDMGILLEKIEIEDIFEVCVSKETFNEKIVTKKVNAILEALTVDEVLNNIKDNFKDRANAYEIFVHKVENNDKIHIKIKAILYIAVDKETLAPFFLNQKHEKH